MADNAADGNSLTVGAPCLCSDALGPSVGCMGDASGAAGATATGLGRSSAGAGDAAGEGAAWETGVAKLEGIGVGASSRRKADGVNGCSSSLCANAGPAAVTAEGPLHARGA